MLLLLIPAHVCRKIHVFLSRLKLCKSHRIVLLLQKLPVLFAVFLNVDLNILHIVLLKPPDLIIDIFVQDLFLGLGADWATEHELCILSVFVLRAVLELVPTRRYLRS